MKINLDKKQFLHNLLIPISKISEECSINFTSDSIFSLINDLNKTTIIFGKIKTSTGIPDQKALKINVKDIKKLVKVIECIDTDNFEIDVDDNCSQLSYKSKSISFKMHLVTDSVIRKVTTSLDKISKITFDSEFSLTQDKLSEILRGSIFATDSNKIYFFTKDGNVFAELTDKTTDNLDSVTFCITDKFTGGQLIDPLPFSLEFLRLLTTQKSEEIKVKINTTYKILLFEISNDLYTLKYILSAYTK